MESTKIMKSFKGYQIFNGITFLILFLVTFILSTIPNKLGWGMNFDVEIFQYISFYVCYVLLFLFGYLIAFRIYQGKGRPNSSLTIKTTQSKVLRISYLCIFFMLIKFINVGDIPLLGNPMSRYTYSLGGFPDYPSRFLPVVAIYTFALYMKVRRPYLLFLAIFSILLPLLFTQRQDAVMGLLGIVLVQNYNKSFSIKRILFFSALVTFTMLIVVSGLAIIRFGSYQLSGGNLSTSELMVWLIHGDMTTATLFGGFVVENMKDFYYGMYSLGEYLSILGLNESAHGAEMLKSQFTESSTAQSIAIPFSYYIDFGIWGICLFSFISGYIASYFYQKAKYTKNIYFIVGFVLIFMQLMWSLRSGIIPFNPIFIYQLLLLFYLFGNSRSNFYNNMIVPGTIGVFSLSFIFALLRF